MKMPDNFNLKLDRTNTNSLKTDFNKLLFGKEDILPMWVADMDLPCAEIIVESIKKRANHPVYGYTYKPDSLFESIINWQLNRHQWRLKKEWITFCPGIVPALYFAVLSHTDPGDKVIVQSPVYFPFFNAVKDTGRIINNNPLILKNDKYVIDFDALERSIDQKTKLLILCNPHNPVGRVWTKEELSRLAYICLKNNILIVSDEIHADLVFSDYRHIPLPMIDNEIAGNTIVYTAASKTFNLAGLSTSIIICPNPEIRKKLNYYLKDNHLDSCNLFGLLATETAFSKGEDWLKSLIKYLEFNRNYLFDAISQRIPKIKMFLPEATYLAWLDFRSLGLHNEALKDFIIHKAGLGLNDGPMFGPGGEGFQRLNFGCRTSLIDEAVTRLENSMKKLS